MHGIESDAPLPDCAALYLWAEWLLRTALEVLKVDKEKWQAAGLPRPEDCMND